MKTTLQQYFFLGLYYGLARHLPHSSARLLGNSSRKLCVLCARHLFKHCGQNVNIEHGAHFGSGRNLELGDNSGIGIHCTVPSNIKIGANVMMGPECFFLINETHEFSRTDLPMLAQGKVVKAGCTEIGDDVWIGRQVLVMPCKHIGSHSIVGAGSVVCKNVPESVIAGGNPIRIIRPR